VTASTSKSDRPKLSPAKRAAFAGVCLLLPVLLVGAAEGVLRVAGFGGAPPTLRLVGPVDENDPSGAGLITTNTAGPASYFFRNRDRAGAIGLFSFESPKPEGTFRVMLFGGSAIKGFPQPPAFTAGAFLERMLADAMPGRDVEVLNFGTTAIASYPVLGIMREALEYEPDLVIVYAGNNEYFGAFGVASLNAGARSGWAMAAQRAFQTTGIGEAIGSLLGRGAGEGSRTLMETMVGQAFVGATDPMREAAERNLERHLLAMGAACDAAGVPMLVCTLACNERDMAPLGVSDPVFSSVGEIERIDTAIDAVLAARPAPMEALPKLLELASTPHARLSFFTGQAFFALGEAAAARENFDLARTWDTMPWRPPPGTNGAIRRAANAGAGTLVDVESVFRDASPRGRVGWELMDDHVHFSLDGQLLLARTLAEALLAEVGAGSVDLLLDDAAYLREAGDNPFDRFGVAHQMRVLMSVPFIESTNPGAAERFDALARSLLSVMPNELRETMTLWQDARTAAGGVRRPASGMAAKAFLRLGRPSDALSLLPAAVASVPEYSSLSLEYEYLELALGAAAGNEEVLGGAAADRARAAIARGRFLLEHATVRTGFTERHVGRLHQLLGEWAEAVPYLEEARDRLGGTDRVAADQALVLSMVRTGRVAEAREIVEFGADASGAHAPAYERMRGMLPPN
jgi:tetratricopeptide (TPR) repeat protein